MIRAEPSDLQHVSGYVSELRNVIGYYTGWVDDDLLMKYGQDEISVFETLNNDDSVYHGMNMLSLMVAGENVEVHSRWQEVSDIIYNAFSYIEDFTHARRSLAYNAILFGLGVQAKFWDQVEFRDYPGITWNVPVKIREADRRRMRLERDPNNRDQVWWSIWSKKYDQYMILKDREEVPGYEPGFCLQDFIFYVADYEETSPFGRGLGSTLFPLAFIREKVKQYWADLSESHSRPWLVMKVDSMKAALDANLGSDNLGTARQKVLDLLDVMENSRGRHQIVIDKSDELQALDIGNQARNIHQELLKYIDGKILQVILGSELTTTTAGGSSSYALGQIHKGGTNSIVMYHRERLEKVLERELLRDFIARNWSNFKRLGQRLGFDFFEPNDIRLVINTESEKIKKKIAESGDSSAAGKVAITM